MFHFLIASALVAEAPEVIQLKVEKARPTDISFVSTRSTRKEPMVQEDEESSLDEISAGNSRLVSIAEVGPFSPFTIIGKSKKNPIEAELTEPTRAELEMVYHPPTESMPNGFYITAQPISNREYEAFVQATYHRPPPHWPEGRVPEGKENEPVVNVTYKDAFLFAIWSGKRLPKDIELEHALRETEVDLNEWTSTPAHKTNQTRATINSELSRITYHKVFTGEDADIRESNYYCNDLGFRVSLNGV